MEAGSARLNKFVTESLVEGYRGAVKHFNNKDLVLGS